MSAINHVFVLMLENRSFDHMLGFSNLRGSDAVSGQPTQIAALQGTEANTYQGTSYRVITPADFSMIVGPGHEFPDVLQQLSGPGAQYPPRGKYPPIANGGFVENFVASGGQQNPGEAMKCFAAGQLPVLTALANNFAVCDNWFSSLPGPTWPNRFFLLAGSSGGLDHSPTTLEMIEWEGINGFRFQNGSIFDQKLWWRIYAGGDLCLAQALKGITFADITPYSRFARDVNDSNYAVQFTLIEPNYGHVASDYTGGTSQHPLDDVTSGEGLIKAVYEAIRNSPIWNTSMLIVTWDEHGGFYDHVAPPAAIAPGDTPQFASANEYQFTFEQYGPRVPAILVSPLIPANTIDHRLYDHSSVPATLVKIFNLFSMTQRDAKANDLVSLAALKSARADAPTSLPAPAKPTLVDRVLRSAAMGLPAPPATRPAEAANSDRNMPGFLYVAMRSDLDLSPPDERPAILARVQSVQTRNDARLYIESVRQKIHAARAGALE
jgi:phospholipase C